MITRHGVPKELLSDLGAAFLFNLQQEVYRLMEIHKVFTTAYHPQTEGLIERFNLTLTSILAISYEDWTGMTDSPMFFLHIIVENRSQRTCPFYMLYGRDPQIPIPETLLRPVDHCHLEVDDYRSQLVSEVWKRARKNVGKAQKQQNKYRVRMPTFAKGN